MGPSGVGGPNLGTSALVTTEMVKVSLSSSGFSGSATLASTTMMTSIQPTEHTQRKRLTTKVLRVEEEKGRHETHG